MIAVDPHASTTPTVLADLGWTWTTPDPRTMHLGRSVYDATGALVGRFLAPQLWRHLRRERLIEFSDAVYAAQFDADLAEYDAHHGFGAA